MSDLKFDTVLDQYGLPIAGALVTIRDADGALVDFGADNPIVTDATGYWEANLDQGTYYLVISKGDDEISRTLDVCADLNLIRRGIGYVDFIRKQTQEYRQPTHIYTAANFNKALSETGVDADLRTSKRIFTTCTIA